MPARSLLHEHCCQRRIGLVRIGLWIPGRYFENYNTPFIPMVALLSFGALLWLQADPTRELFPDEQPDRSLAAVVRT